MTVFDPSNYCAKPPDGARTFAAGQQPDLSLQNEAADADQPARHLAPAAILRRCSNCSSPSAGPGNCSVRPRTSPTTSGRSIVGVLPRPMRRRRRTTSDYGADLPMRRRAGRTRWRASGTHCASGDGGWQPRHQSHRDVRSRRGVEQARRGRTGRHQPRVLPGTAARQTTAAGLAAAGPGPEPQGGRAGCRAGSGEGAAPLPDAQSGVISPRPSGCSMSERAATRHGSTGEAMAAQASSTGS